MQCFHVHCIPFSACRRYSAGCFFYSQNSILTCHSLQVT
nr:MAG TPA: hypothetical protein [Caudoviricetes sp.]